MHSMTEVRRISGNARTLAQALDALPEDVEAPTHTWIEGHRTQPEAGWLLFGAGEKNVKERTAAIIRAIGGKWDKKPGDLYAFETVFAGVRLHITVQRDVVCERVVTGTREVTKTVPAPDAPTIEITETVEDVEWVCAPLLAESVSS